MANLDNANGFKFVKCLYGEAVLQEVTLAGTVSKGDTLVWGSGTATIGLSNSGLILGVAAEDGVSGDDILFYPALPGYVFEAQCSGTYAETIRWTSVDLEGATGVQEVDENATTELVCRVIGHDPNSAIGTNTRVYVTFPRSSFTGAEDAQ